MKGIPVMKQETTLIRAGNVRIELIWFLQFYAEA